MNPLSRTLRHFITLFSTALLATACTDADPQMAQRRNLDIFDLSTPQISTSNLTTVAVVAKCSPMITSVELSFDNGATWLSSSTYDAGSNFACATTKDFALTLSQTKSPWSAMSISAGQNLSVLFRATSRTGNTVTRSLNVLFTPSLQISQELLIGSERAQSGGGYRLHSRLRHQKQNIATGTGLILRGRVVQ